MLAIYGSSMNPLQATHTCYQHAGPLTGRLISATVCLQRQRAAGLVEVESGSSLQPVAQTVAQGARQLPQCCIAQLRLAFARVHTMHLFG